MDRISKDFLMKKILLILSFIITSSQIIGSQKPTTLEQYVKGLKVDPQVQELVPYFENPKHENGGITTYDVGKLRISYPSGVVRTKYPNESVKVQNREGLFVAIDRYGGVITTDSYVGDELDK